MPARALQQLRASAKSAHYLRRQNARLQARLQTARAEVRQAEARVVEKDKALQVEQETGLYLAQFVTCIAQTHGVVLDPLIQQLSQIHRA